MTLISHEAQEELLVALLNSPKVAVYSTLIDGHELTELIPCVGELVYPLEMHGKSGHTWTKRAEIERPIDLLTNPFDVMRDAWREVARLNDRAVLCEQGERHARALVLLKSDEIKSLREQLGALRAQLDESVHVDELPTLPRAA